ncbi:HD domain-containing protein, partial [bacterium]|nr:HD domain-containing protein [bacterium]
LLNIKDVYNIPSTVEYRINKEFDLRTGYRSKSMLVVPMRDHTDEIIGVLQLINSLDNDGQTIPFDQDYESVILSLASQAAVAIRNVRLIEDIKKLFRSLVRYSAKAIDARSPQTAGHSGRVARFSVRVAQAINEETEGRLGAIHFTPEEIEELRMAGWLHDIGKIGVSESVLEKSNKLSDERLKVICERFETIKLAIKNHYLQQKIELLSDGDNHFHEIQRCEAAMQRDLQTVANDHEIIKQINIPGDIDADSQELLKAIAGKKFLGSDGIEKPYVTPKEYEDLSIMKGNLSEDEYKEMQSHVEHTISILNKIPFTKDLERIPQIAAAHHEYLDGSGYPKGLKGDEICIQGRIMCIADIFDALRSPDRPYKSPLSLAKTIDVLEREAAAGKLDSDIVELFVGKKLYQRTSEEDDED